MIKISNTTDYRLGQNIARIRKQETGYTQSEMEDYAGIFSRVLWKNRTRSHSATIDALIKIADAFKYSHYIELFLDENDNPI